MSWDPVGKGGGVSPGFPEAVGGLCLLQPGVSVSLRFPKTLIYFPFLSAPFSGHPPLSGTLLHFSCVSVPPLSKSLSLVAWVSFSF